MRYRTTLSRALSIDQAGCLLCGGLPVFGMGFIKRMFLTGVAIGAPDMVGFKTRRAL